MEELTPNVYGYLQPDGGWCLSNAGVIVGDGSVTVIDTLATQARAIALRERVRALAAGPVTTVVNTHVHGDHTFGNQFFAEATMIGHRLLREEMLAMGLAMTQLWPEVEWGDLRVTPPTVLLEDRLTIYVGDIEVQLLHVGPAHTTNDVVAWLPAQRVLFAGDVLMSGCTPFVLMGSLSGSLLAIERLRALQPQLVLSGHGKVAGPEVLDTNAEYLRWLSGVADAGKRADLSLLELARATELGEYAGLLDSGRIVANLRRAYAEIDGAQPGDPVDVLAAFEDISQLAGGRLPACWA
ncbi:MAG TPA: MBL fold metallo-hydrolase [Jatrophihabitans sp.]|nr:MBL fold metallo-hydrolase [Jatrophihabitans sp.]